MKWLMRNWSAPVALTILLSSAPLVGAQTNSTAAEQTPAEKPQEIKFDQGVLFPYSLFDQALNGRTDTSGNVDYLAMRGNESLALFIRAVGSADLKAFPVWKEVDEQGKEHLDRSAELVFWINAHNAHVIKAISDAYPIKSVDDLKDFYTEKSRLIAGETYSLAEVRDRIIKMDPRAYFALTDGTRGGPMMWPSAYRLTGLSRALDEAVSAFVNDMRNVELTRIQDRVALNEYFKEADRLFQSKFKGGKWSGIRYVLMTYTKQSAQRKYFTTNPVRVDFKAKDNTLNNVNL